MIGDKGVLGALYSIPLLFDSAQQAKGVARRLEVIEFGPFLNLASEVLIVAP